MKRNVIACIATSADGYIARLDDSIDWLDRPSIPGDYGMGAFVRKVDTILWGRKTYQQSLARGGAAVFGPKLKHYVFSHSAPAGPTQDVEFVNEPVPLFAQRLRATPGKHIWVMGGGELIASFLDAGEIDEFSIHVIPTFIGEGIPLIAPRHRLVPLELRSVRRFSDGVVHLGYRVPPQSLT